MRAKRTGEQAKAAGEQDRIRWRAPEIIQRRAKELRKEMTGAERKNQIEGAYFRRQHAVGPYILDFICTEAKLVVEVDGSTHLTQEVYDTERTEWLKGKGYRVIRFTNDVMKNINAVVEVIRDALQPPP